MEQLELVHLLVLVEGVTSTTVERALPGNSGARKPPDLPYDGTNETEKT